MNQVSKPGVFLDTSAVVELLFKDRKIAGVVRTVLEAYGPKYSSEYVRMEIKRGVLQYFVFLHNKAVECERLSDVFRYIQRLSSTPLKHRLGTMGECISNFYASIENQELSDLKGAGKLGEFQKAMLAAFLRVRIRRFWNAFDRLLDVVIDTIECYRNRYNLHPPKVVGNLFDNSFENCDRYKPGICTIKDFVSINAEGYSSIQRALEEQDDPDQETIKRIRAIKEILRHRNTSRPITRQQCWWTGDATIVLEAPDECVILSKNSKHFRPICGAIDRTFVSY